MRSRRARHIHSTRWHRQTIQPRRQSKNILIFVFFIACFSWFVYFFLFSANFKIKTVKIEGQQTIPGAELSSLINNNLSRRRWWLFNNNNIFLFSKKELRVAITKKYALETLVISKQLPATLKVKIQEKQARMILRAQLTSAAGGGGESEVVKLQETVAGTSSSTVVSLISPPPDVTTVYYYVDANGIVVSQGNINNDDLKKMPVVEITFADKKDIKAGERVLERAEVEYIFSVYDTVAKAGLAINIDYVIVEPKINDEIKFVTSEGWQVFITKKIMLETQIKKLALALQEKIKDKRKGLKCVDLRIKDHVYWK